jgi:hypothetical protein
MTPAPLLVLPPFTDTRPSTDWHDAFATAGWPNGLVDAELPGRIDAPPPVGGNYELVDPAIAVMHRCPPAVASGSTTAPIVVGIGSSGWSAHLLALGGRAGGLVLVDGLGAPWVTPSEAFSWQQRLLRSIADDPRALDAPPVGERDPRLDHPMSGHGSRRLAERALESTPVPTLIIGTPDSQAPFDDVHELSTRAPAGATVIELESVALPNIASAVVTWFVSTFRPDQSSTQQ